MMDLGLIRNEIERMRVQVGRQRREILAASTRGTVYGFRGSAAGAHAVQDRQSLRRAGPAQDGTSGAIPRTIARTIAGQGIGRPAMVSGPRKYFHDDPDPPPFIKALAEVRRIGVLEGWCYHHVQAIIVAIDQYAEAATGNREFFWNKPHSMAAAAGTITSLSHRIRVEEHVVERPVVSPPPGTAGHFFSGVCGEACEVSRSVNLRNPVTPWLHRPVG